MSVPATPTRSTDDSAIESDELFRLNVDQYHEMIAQGTLASGDPIELIDGLLFCKMSKNPRHVSSGNKLRMALEKLVPAGWSVRAQDPITLQPISEPEPDAVIARGTDDDYADRHPTAAEVALVCEVADSSLSRDQNRKSSTYARAGIPMYWLINLQDNQLEVYSSPNPDAGRYEKAEILRSGDSAVLTLAGDRVGEIQVSSILP